MSKRAATGGAISGELSSILAMPESAGWEAAHEDVFLEVIWLSPSEGFTAHEPRRRVLRWACLASPRLPARLGESGAPLRAPSQIETALLRPQ